MIASDHFHRDPSALAALHGHNCLCSRWIEHSNQAKKSQGAADVAMFQTLVVWFDVATRQREDSQAIASHLMGYSNNCVFVERPNFSVVIKRVNAAFQQSFDGAHFVNDATLGVAHSMNSRPRWDKCIFHRGPATEAFLIEFFADRQRRLLIIAGAGFDPRSVLATELLARVGESRITGMFLREHRPNPAESLKNRGDENEVRLRKLISDHSVESIQIFDQFLAIVGGVQIVSAATKINPLDFTDIVIDASAMSTGIVFPLTRYLLQRVERHATNLHLLVSASAKTDDQIVSIPHDKTSLVHGFKGNFGLSDSSEATKLWLPQLVADHGQVLGRIYSTIEPDLVCPILPFPSVNCRSVDELLDEYRESLDAWEVDNRNLMFAAEDDPLDLYRAILQIDRTRSRIFQNIGGSKTIVTPLGSKLLAIGSLMAAIEKDFPVVYVESVSYKVQPTIESASPGATELVHLWLSGEAYDRRP
jgi:hypothetical protein